MNMKQGFPLILDANIGFWQISILLVLSKDHSLLMSDTIQIHKMEFNFPDRLRMHFAWMPNGSRTIRIIIL